MAEKDLVPPTSTLCFLPGVWRVHKFWAPWRKIPAESLSRPPGASARDLSLCLGLLWVPPRSVAASEARGPGHVWNFSTWLSGFSLAFLADAAGKLCHVL